MSFNLTKEAKKQAKSNAIKNWNFLLGKVDTPFFVLNHHDDCPNNLAFLDHLDKDITGILLLPCTSYVSNKKFARVSSRHQRINITLFKNIPNVLISLFLAPTASVIINKKLELNKFNEKLKWYVDNDWYYRIINDCEDKKLNLSFFSETRIISNQTKNSITFKIKNDLERIKINEKNLLKESKLVPNRFIHLFQKIISLFLILDSKLVRFLRIFK